ncbi:MAG: tRNA (adenosine(37)-N6)-threonylcarbamoyltransferase complex transferase subunit TsaD, partial [Candidatus Portnoybacteria bacterium]|nr:tRNA (adenosine(37)-N6)-threonylcarbamoyltransferase complex transferase subunit TsaD [Candidatus Portnoybacteria bacterium]
GPGLEPALWAGVNLARALACFWRLPIIPANHIKGHLLAALAEKKSDKNYFPAIGLVVSGGHTQLVLIEISSGNVLKYRIIGETRDDAAGEAFDKVAKMLGLGYPGGPIIAAKAAKFKIENLKLKINKLPRPMLRSGDFDFSFSGLKTAVLYTLQKMSPAQIKRQTPAIAAEFQQAVIDVLSAKTSSAVKKHEAKTIVLAGGVAANSALRQELKNQAKKMKVKFLSPAPEFCSDNAAMIALAAEEDIGRKTGWQKIKADANWRIG